ncbi:MAG: type II secretion system protein GspL [Pseudomonadota bacterium]
MNEALIAYLGETPDDPIAWTAVREGVAISHGVADGFDALAPALADLPEHITVGAILPGELAAYRRLPAPPKSDAKFRAAAALLLEDELAEPIDDLHVGVAREDGEGVLVALKAALVTEWTEAFAMAGAALRFMTVDYLCAPAPSPDAAASALILGDRVLARGRGQRFAAETGLAGLALARLVDETDDATGVDVHGPEGWLKPHGWPEPRSIVVAKTGGVAEEAARQALAEEGLNLLQGPFQPPRRVTFDVAPYRRAAAMAAGLVAGLVALSAVEAQRTSAMAARYDREARRIYAEAFPEAPTRDIRSQARGRLSTGGAATFLDVTRRIDAAIDEEEVAIDRIQYDAGRGALSFSVRSASNESIDAFRERLAAEGVRATDVSGYRRSGDAWIGDMAVGL